MAAAVIGLNELSAKKEGIVATIPNDDRAKLMYYLKCINSLLGPEGKDIIPWKYQNFQNYSQIKSLQEKKTLLYLSALLEPHKLEGKCIFRKNDIAGDNEFYEIKQVSNILAVSESIVINGKVTQLAKIMVYRDSWILEICMLPLLNLYEQVKKEESRPKQSTTCAVL